MIISFRNKGLKELFEEGSSRKINSKLQAKCIRILDALDDAAIPSDMNVLGFDFHSLNGFTPTRYTAHVNGPWCITFEFSGENVARVYFEQYQ